MVAIVHAQYRRESYIHGGWNIGVDDDLPHAPECDPLDSAQRKRYLRSTPACCSHRKPDGGHVE